MLAMLAVIIGGVLLVALGEVLGDELRDHWSPGAWRRWLAEYRRHREEARLRATREG